MDYERDKPRLSSEQTVFVEVLGAGAGDGEPGTVVPARSVNVSADGLMVAVEHEVRVDSILQIGIRAPGTDEPLYLAAQARWCRAADSPGLYWVGFELLAASNSDIDTWTELIAALPQDQE